MRTRSVARSLALRARHHQVARVITDAAARSDVDRFIDHEFDELDRVTGALAVLREVTPRWLDAIAAAGEILSSRLVAAALSSRGLSAAWIDARLAVVTGGEHTSAPPLMAETEAALGRVMSPALADRRIPVIGGFVGATADGVTTTLGRGGSDYSASIVGACLGATEIQIWTDVDGMLTADPRLVPGVHVVPHISFGEASELAYFGAKVLHPATIQPAVGRNIPVRILNSKRPEDPRGTLITRERPESDHPLTAVASKTNVTVVDITSTRMLMAHGFLSRIFSTFERFRTSVDVVTTSEVSVSVTIDDARRLPEIAEALQEVADVTHEDRMAIICAVGDGLQQDPTFVRHLLEAMGDVPIRMVSQAAARRNITLVIRRRGSRTGPSRRTRTLLRGPRVRILIIGHGRMGRLVESLAPSYGCDIAAIAEIDAPVAAVLDRAGHVDVAIDFSQAEAVAGNLPALAARQVNVVIGTTGWQAHEAELRDIAARADLGVLASANFSVGMNVFALVVEEAARLFGAHESTGAWIHESHHAAKADAPSGTALLLEAAMREAGYPRRIDVSSTRAGSMPGTHVVGFDGPAETVTLTHTVRDRAVFAHGALEAAKWIRGRQGWFTMRDLLGR